MHIVTSADPVAAIRAQARERARPMTERIFHFLVAVWQRHLERRIERAARELDHPGVLDDFMRAARRG